MLRFLQNLAPFELQMLKRFMAWLASISQRIFEKDSNFKRTTVHYIHVDSDLILFNMTKIKSLYPPFVCDFHYSCNILIFNNVKPVRENNQGKLEKIQSNFKLKICFSLTSLFVGLITCIHCPVFPSPIFLNWAWNYYISVSFFSTKGSVLRKF